MSMLTYLYMLDGIMVVGLILWKLYGVWQAVRPGYLNVRMLMPDNTIDGSRMKVANDEFVWDSFTYKVRSGFIYKIGRLREPISYYEWKQMEPKQLRGAAAGPNMVSADEHNIALTKHVALDTINSFKPEVITALTSMLIIILCVLAGAGIIFFFQQKSFKDVNGRLDVALEALGVPAASATPTPTPTPATHTTPTPAAPSTTTPGPAVTPTTSGPSTKPGTLTPLTPPAQTPPIVVPPKVGP